MTLLLGDVPGSSVVAESSVEVYIMQHTTLKEQLEGDPKMCGRVFKMMAATLSERIGEASSKMRQEVVAKSSKKAATVKPSQDVATLNANKYRQLFNLHKDEALMLRTTCSMRKEANGAPSSASGLAPRPWPSPLGPRPSRASPPALP